MLRVQSVPFGVELGLGEPVEHLFHRRELGGAHPRIHKPFITDQHHPRRPARMRHLLTTVGAVGVGDTFPPAHARGRTPRTVPSRPTPPTARSPARAANRSAGWRTPGPTRPPDPPPTNHRPTGRHSGAQRCTSLAVRTRRVTVRSDTRIDAFTQPRTDTCPSSPNTPLRSAVATIDAATASSLRIVRSTSPNRAANSRPSKPSNPSPNTATARSTALPATSRHRRHQRTHVPQYEQGVSQRVSSRDGRRNRPAQRRRVTATNTGRAARPARAIAQRTHRCHADMRRPSRDPHLRARTYVGDRRHVIAPPSTHTDSDGDDSCQTAGFVHS